MFDAQLLTWLMATLESEPEGEGESNARERPRRVDSTMPPPRDG